MGRLAGKVAVVTGIGPGNGSAISQTFAREGADLVLATFLNPALEETVAAVKALGRRVVVIGPRLTPNARPCRPSAWRGQLPSGTPLPAMVIVLPNGRVNRIP